MLTIDELTRRFVYKADKRDKWTVLNAESGPLKGDCDDFALTALWIEAGGSWLRILWMVLTFQACMWFTISPKGGGHYMLWRRGKGWIDNWYPVWGKRRHPLMVPYVFPLFLIALVIK